MLPPPPLLRKLHLGPGKTSHPSSTPPACLPQLPLSNPGLSLLPTSPCRAGLQPMPALPLLMSSVPETVRILGSLLVILLLFALTAALVKVDMSPGPFFSITMASVWFINCEHCCPSPPPHPVHPGLQPSLFFVTERAQHIQEGNRAAVALLSVMRN